MRMFILLAITAASVATASPPPPKTPPPETSTAPAAPRTVVGKSDLVGEGGQRATVVGVLSRVTHEQVEATAIVLADGASVFVAQGPPPEGWAWMIGTKVRVQGALWPLGAQSAGAWPVPTLTEPEPPMPADVAMPGMGF